MIGINVTTDEAAQCLSRLKEAVEPLPAAEIAACLHLPGSHETQRRHVRAIIKRLRDNGEMIIASLQAGYVLTYDTSRWRGYLEGRQIDAKKVLGETHRRKRMVADSKGQGILFQQRSSGQLRCISYG